MSFRLIDPHTITSASVPAVIVSPHTTGGVPAPVAKFTNDLGAGFVVFYAGLPPTSMLGGKSFLMTVSSDLLNESLVALTEDGAVHIHLAGGSDTWRTFNHSDYRGIDNAMSEVRDVLMGDDIADL